MKNTLIGIMLPVMAASAALSAQTESLISAAAPGLFPRTQKNIDIPRFSC